MGSIGLSASEMNSISYADNFHSLDCSSILYIRYLISWSPNQTNTLTLANGYPLLENYKFYEKLKEK